FSDLAEIPAAVFIAPRRETSGEDDLESAQLVAMTKAAGSFVRSLNIHGDPAREILNVARRERADIIVMGVDQKWHTGWSDERVFQRFLRNSTVTRVVQQAPCPVWLDKSSDPGNMD